MVLWVVWLLLFPLMVMVSLLGGSLFLFGCGLGSVYFHVAFCMLLCRGCSFCSAEYSFSAFACDVALFSTSEACQSISGVCGV